MGDNGRLLIFFLCFSFDVFVLSDVTRSNKFTRGKMEPYIKSSISSPSSPISRSLSAQSSLTTRSSTTDVSHPMAASKKSHKQASETTRMDSGWLKAWPPLTSMSPPRQTAASRMNDASRRKLITSGIRDGTSYIPQSIASMAASTRTTPTKLIATTMAAATRTTTSTDVTYSTPSPTINVLSIQKTLTRSDAIVEKATIEPYDEIITTFATSTEAKNDDECGLFRQNSGDSITRNASPADCNIPDSTADEEQRSWGELRRCALQFGRNVCQEGIPCLCFEVKFKSSKCGKASSPPPPSSSSSSPQFTTASSSRRKKHNSRESIEMATVSGQEYQEQSPFKKICFQFLPHKTTPTSGIKTSTEKNVHPIPFNKTETKLNLDVEPCFKFHCNQSSNSENISMCSRAEKRKIASLENSHKDDIEPILSAKRTNSLLPVKQLTMAKDLEIKMASDEIFERKLKTLKETTIGKDELFGNHSMMARTDKENELQHSFLESFPHSTPIPKISSQNSDTSIFSHTKHHSSVTGEDPPPMTHGGKSHLASSSTLSTIFSADVVVDEGITSASSSIMSSSISSFNSSSAAAALLFSLTAKHTTLSSSGSSISPAPAQAISSRMARKQLVNNLDASMEANREPLFCLCSPGHYGLTVVSVEAYGQEGIDQLRRLPLQCLQGVRKLKVVRLNTQHISLKYTSSLPSDYPWETITTNAGINLSTFLREMPPPTQGGKVFPSSTSNDEIQSSENWKFSSETVDRIYSSNPGWKMDAHVRTGGSVSQRRLENVRVHSTVANKFPDNPIIASIMAWIKGYKRMRCVDKKIPDTARHGDLQQAPSGGDNESIPNLRGVSTVIMALDEDRSINCFRFPGIKYLDLTGISVQSTDIQILAEFMTDLKHLNLSYNGLKVLSHPDGENGTHTTQSRSLEYLSFYGLKESPRMKNLAKNYHSICSNSKVKFRVLDLSHDFIQTWPSVLLRRHPFCSVVKFYLSHNEIQRIPPHAVEELMRLKYLDLSHNRLEYLEVGSFTSKYLSHIDLSFNKLKIIGSMTFLYLPSLTELKLDNNALENIGKMAFYRVCDRNNTTSQLKRKKVKIFLDNNHLMLDSIWKWHAPFPGHRDKDQCPILIHLNNNSIERLFNSETEKYFEDLLATNKSSMLKKLCKSWTNLRLDLSQNDLTCDCRLIRQMVILKRLLNKASHYGNNNNNNNNNVQKINDLDWLLPDWRNITCRDTFNATSEMKRTSLNEYFIRSDCLEKLCPLMECLCTWNDFRLEILNCSGRLPQSVGRNKRAKPDEDFSLRSSRFHLGLLETVHTIDLSNNRIKSLDSFRFLGKCTHVENLYLHSNLFFSIPEFLTKISNLRSVTLKNNPVCCHCSSYQGRNLTNVLELLKDLDNISCFDPIAKQSNLHSTKQSSSRVIISNVFLLKNPNGFELSLAVALLLLTVCAIVLTVSSAIVYYKGTSFCKLPGGGDPSNVNDHLKVINGCSWIESVDFHENSNPFNQSCPVFSNFISKSMHGFSKPFPIALTSKLRKKSKIKTSHERLLFDGIPHSLPALPLHSVERYHGNRHGKSHSCFLKRSKEENNKAIVGHCEELIQHQSVFNHFRSTSDPPPPPSSSSPPPTSPPSSFSMRSEPYLRAFYATEANIETDANLPEPPSTKELVGSERDPASRSIRENLGARFREALRAINSQLTARINNIRAAEQRTLAEQFINRDASQRF